jgi:Double zinc ribbon
VFLNRCAGQLTSRVTRPPSNLASLHDVFNSTAFQVARNITLFVVCVFWLGMAYWVYRDARRRIDDHWLIGTAAVLGLVPILGPLVYLLFRPPETLEEQHARRVEVQALESRLLQQPPHCPVCRTAIEPSFLICPVCTTTLKEPCVSCGAPLERLWQACPYCATPVTAKAGEVAIDLDAALTAEATRNGNGNGKAARVRTARSRAPKAR